MYKNWKLVLGAALAIGLTVAAPVRALAQEGVDDKIIPSIELNQAEIRDALRILFKNVGVSYSVDPTVVGTVTVDMKNQPFITVLRNILNQVDATYRVEAGIYVIVRREQGGGETGGGNNEPAPQVSQNEVIRRLKIRSADPLFIMIMLGGSQSTSVFPEQSTIANAGGIGNQGGGGGGFGGGGFGGGGQGGGFGGGGFGGGGFGSGGPGLGGGGGGRGGGGGGGRFGG